jgi:hypothetical protein
MLCTMVAAKGKYTLKQCQDYMQLQRQVRISVGLQRFFCLTFCADRRVVCGVQVCMFDSGDEADALNLEFMKLGSR